MIREEIGEADFRATRRRAVETVLENGVVIVTVHGVGAHRDEGAVRICVLKRSENESMSLALARAFARRREDVVLDVRCVAQSERFETVIETGDGLSVRTSRARLASLLSVRTRRITRRTELTFVLAVAISTERAATALDKRTLGFGS